MVVGCVGVFGKVEGIIVIYFSCREVYGLRVGIIFELCLRYFKIVIL